MGILIAITLSVFIISYGYYFIKIVNSDKDATNNTYIINKDEKFDEMRQKFDVLKIDYEKNNKRFVNELVESENKPFITDDNLKGYKKKILLYLDKPDDFDMLSLVGLNYVYHTKRSFRIPYLVFSQSPYMWYHQLFRYGIFNLDNPVVEKLCIDTDYDIHRAREIQKEKLQEYYKRIEELKN